MQGEIVTGNREGATMIKSKTKKAKVDAKEAPVAPVRKWEKDSTKINEVCDKWFEDEVMDTYYGVQKRFLKTGALYELKVVVGRLLEAEVQDALNGRKV